MHTYQINNYKNLYIKNINLNFLANQIDNLVFGELYAMVAVLQSRASVVALVFFLNFI
jgi:hypothetical protein